MLRRLPRLDLSGLANQKAADVEEDLSALFPSDLASSALMPRPRRGTPEV